MSEDRGPGEGSLSSFFFKRFYLFTFREGKERDITSMGERYLDWLPPTRPNRGHALTGN